MPTPPDYKVKSYSHFAAHCSVTAKAQDKFTRYQNVERYRRLLKTATGEEGVQICANCGAEFMSGEAAQNGAQGAAKRTRGLRGNVRVSPAI
jgi:hypothetical protein